MSTFELYRRSTIGTCLTETLDGMVENGTLTPELAFQVLIQFDKSMTEALELQVKTKVSIKAIYFNDLSDFCASNLQTKIMAKNLLGIGSTLMASADILGCMPVASHVLIEGHLHTYRFCDSTWTFILQDAVFKSGDFQENVSKVKMVACDSKLLTQ